MSGRIPRAFIDDLVGKADIVEIIGSAGAAEEGRREYRACCPFHNEKTPVVLGESRPSSSITASAAAPAARCCRS